MRCRKILSAGCVRKLRRFHARRKSKTSNGILATSRGTLKKNFLLIKEIIQGNSSSGNSRKASSVTTSVLISMGHRRKIMHPIRRQSADTRQSVSPVGLGIFTLLLLVSSWFAVVTDLLGAPFAVIAAVFVLLLGVSGGMLGKGISLLKRTNRLKCYLKTVGSSQFCPIDMLVRDSGRDKNFVLRDLQKMIRKKVLPGAHIDDQKTCLMLTDEVYNQYLYVQQQAQQREKEKQKRQEELKKQQQEQAKQDEQLFAENPELAATIRQGREMIEQIRRSNDKIEGEEISAKMDQMETIAKKIFEQVQEHPEKLPDIRRLMNYYLPTTLKLLNVYEEFDSQPVQGENIRSAKLRWTPSTLPLKTCWISCLLTRCWMSARTSPFWKRCSSRKG